MPCKSANSPTISLIKSDLDNDPALAEVSASNPTKLAIYLLRDSMRFAFSAIEPNDFINKTFSSSPNL